MKYRKLDASGDRVFGGDQQAFFIDDPEAVGQAVMTRLRLGLGEWFLNTSDGTAWNTQVLGYHTQGTRDIVIQERVLGTPGLVTSSNPITQYSSSVNPNTRAFSVSMTIETIYGAAQVKTPL